MRKTLQLLILLVVLALAGLIASFLPSALKGQEQRALVKGVDTPEKTEAALKSYSPEKLEELLQLERLAFRGEPLGLSAMQNIVVLESLRGRKAEAEAAARALADYSQRSITAQLAVIQIEFGKQYFSSAYSRLDGVLRAREELAPRLFMDISASLGNKDALAAFAQILSQDPPWRGAYLASLLKDRNTVNLAISVMQAMRKTNAVIKDSEKQVLLGKLIKDKRFDVAYFVWLDMLDKSELARAGNVFDGSFTSAPRNLFFDWNLVTRLNSRIRTESRPGKAQDRYLEIDMFIDKEPGPFVFQYLNLSPGQYDFSYEYQAESLKVAKGLVWQLICVENLTVAAESPAITEDGRWQNQSFKLSVPETACPVQFLQLAKRGTTGLDLETSGKLMVDNVAMKLMTTPEQ